MPLLNLTLSCFPARIHLAATILKRSYLRLCHANEKEKKFHYYQSPSTHLHQIMYHHLKSQGDHHPLPSSHPFVGSLYETNKEKLKTLSISKECCFVPF